MTTQASAPQALGYVGVRAKDLGDWASGASGHTRRIAEFVSRLNYAQIPAEVYERLKLLILDSLGCAIYGADLEWCRVLRQTLERADQTKTTSIWGTDRRLSSPHADSSTARRCKASSSMTFTARAYCMSAPSRCRR